MKVITAWRLIWNGFMQGDAFSRFILAEKLSGFIYPEYKFSEFGRIFLKDRAFLNYYESFAGKQNYHSLDRKYTLAQLLKITQRLQGDTAECGVYQGASSYLICKSNLGTAKIHHLFDSFEGLSSPQSIDGSYWTQGDLRSSENEPRERLSEFKNVIFHKGWIPTRFEEVTQNQFSFVHLDVDLYQPTWDSLVFFYDRMVPGGIIICDDYGFTTCPGATKAFDQFLENKKEPLIQLTTGQALIIKLN